MLPKKILDTNRTGVINAGNPSVYTSPFGSDSGKHSLHYESVQTVATFAVTAELWGSNKPNPDKSNDNDWVLVDGAPFATLPGGTTKGFSELGGKAMTQYRVKFSRTTGEGHIVVYYDNLHSGD